MNGKQRVAELMDRYGCLPRLGEHLGEIPEFDADRLGQTLEQAINKAKEYGLVKVTLHMDIPDAAKLAKHLRK